MFVWLVDAGGQTSAEPTTLKSFGLPRRFPRPPPRIVCGQVGMLHNQLQFAYFFNLIYNNNDDDDDDDID